MKSFQVLLLTVLAVLVGSIPAILPDFDKWDKVAEQTDNVVTTTPVSAQEFLGLVKGSTNRLVARVCPNCVDSHDVVYYKRKTAIPNYGTGQANTPSSFFNLFLSNWYKTDNELGTDFDLYSTYRDAVLEQNQWRYCNYTVGGGIGFPHNCGPSGSVINQWNTYVSGQSSPSPARTHAFYVEPACNPLGNQCQTDADCCRAPLRFQCLNSTCEVCRKPGGMCTRDDQCCSGRCLRFPERVCSELL